jgi:hypothetical protein
MPRVGIEPTIPAFQRTKTVHALDRAAAVVDFHFTYPHQNFIITRKNTRRHDAWKRKTVSSVVNYYINDRDTQ